MVGVQMLSGCILSCGTEVSESSPSKGGVTSFSRESQATSTGSDGSGKSGVSSFPSASNQDGSIPRLRVPLFLMKALTLV